MLTTNELLNLKGKTVIVTGSGGVICSKLVDGLAAVGMNVVLLDRKPERGGAHVQKLEAEYPGQKFATYPGDVMIKESLVAAKEEILKDFGTIDFLVNGAGGNSADGTSQAEEILPGKNDDVKNFFGMTVDGFGDVFDLNFKGTLLPTMVFSDVMVAKGEGGILNISSMSAYHPLTKVGAYSAAKAAINSFTEWLSVHFAKTGVRVNAIAPGFFLTNQNRFLLTDEKTGAPTARGQKIINNTPMGRYGDVEELVGGTIFLLSGMSKFVTGIVLPIDGGFNAFGGV